MSDAIQHYKFNFINKTNEPYHEKEQKVKISSTANVSELLAKTCPNFKSLKMREKYMGVNLPRLPAIQTYSNS